MGQKIRSLQSAGGANLNESGWADMGDYYVFASFTSTATATIYPFQVITQDTSIYDSLTPGLGSAINRLQGGQIAFTGATAMVAQSTLNLGLVVYRSFGVLSTQITNGGGALTSLAVAAGVNTAMPSGQTFTLVNAAGTVQTWTASAAVVRGALSVPVNSQTPTGTNAVGNQLIGQVGNGILFGWLAATGTPALYLLQTTPLPAVTANITAAGGNTVGDPYGAFVPLLPGDLIALQASSAGSVTVQSGIIGTLVA
jgi:hypothetical protein